MKLTFRSKSDLQKNVEIKKPNIHNLKKCVNIKFCY